MTLATAIPVDIEAADASTVLSTALRALGRDRIALASSFGAEDMVIVDLLARLVDRPRVFTLDTARLPQETYDLMDATRRRYGIEVEVYFPNAIDIQAMVLEKGLNLFTSRWRTASSVAGCARSSRSAEPCRRWTAGSRGCDATRS
jgi:phosphoadenosine phosphosulfate reductase